MEIEKYILYTEKENLNYKKKKKDDIKKVAEIATNETTPTVKSDDLGADLKKDNREGFGGSK